MRNRAKPKRAAKADPPRPGFKIAGETVPPGARKTLNFPVARLYTHTELNLPIHVVHGKRKGPVLLVSAALHGDEIAGVEIIRRLLKSRSLTKIRGTLLAVPAVNVYGFLNKTRYLPDRRDLNRSFPGKAEGSLTARLAHLFHQKILKRATHAIDLHTGSNHRINLPQIRINPGNRATLRMAGAFGAPVVLIAPGIKGSLRALAAREGIEYVLYESGEPLRFYEGSIQTGLLGILNVMRDLRMLPPGLHKKKKKIQSFSAEKTQWVRAPQSGILYDDKPLGANVRRGEVLARISDPFGDNGFLVKSPVPGVVIGKTVLPLVDNGAALFHVASFKNPGKVSKEIRTLRGKLIEQMDEQEFPRRIF